ncbi:unnamed protein product [Allacma fusca]|uniref:CHIP N-terminal tetratricopeptide repeat domain-containing protein n=1 Tax=Allacma fusca TaxID=39272 RepID=A0A8J2LEU3_9HEXA|nr:unnamed protein product [Allacma fusca]
MEAKGNSDADIASLVFKMKGMDVLDKDSLALVPAGTFSRSLWHAAALSSELNRMLRIQDQIYRQYREEHAMTSTVIPDNTGTSTVEVKEESPSTSLVPFNQKTTRRRKYRINDCSSYSGERFKWRIKRPYPIDSGTSEDYMEDARGYYCPQKRRYNIPVIQRDATDLDGENTLCYSRINGKPLYQDRRFKCAEMQMYLLNLINEDRTRQVDEIQKASANNAHEVDGKIMQIENFLNACKTELTTAFAITQGIRQHGIKGMEEMVRDKAMIEILRKAGITVSSNDDIQVTPEEINPYPEGINYGCTVQEFPDD